MIHLSVEKDILDNVSYRQLYVVLALLLISCFKSSRPDVFCEKGVLGNFAKFTGKHLCQSLFLMKLQAAPATLLKKRPCYRCFPVSFAKFLRTAFFTKHLWWLLLLFQICNIFSLTILTEKIFYSIHHKNLLIQKFGCL